MFDNLHFLKINISVLLMTENGWKIKSESYKSNHDKIKKAQIKKKYYPNTYQRSLRCTIWREVSKLSINKLQLKNYREI